MRHKIIAANWKMNLTHREARPYLDALLAELGELNPIEVVLIPPFTAIPALAEALTKPKYGDGIEWKLKQDVDFLRDA